MSHVELKYSVSKGDDVTHWFKNERPDFMVEAGCDLTVDESTNARIVTCEIGPALIMRNGSGRINASKYTHIIVKKPTND